jgi:hypothetical protein
MTKAISIMIVAVISCYAALTAPDSVKLSVIGDSLLDVKVEWNDNSDNEDGFAIERKASGSDWEEIARTSADKTEYLDTHLVAGTTYLYRIRAFASGEQYSDYTSMDYIIVSGIPYIVITGPNPDSPLTVGTVTRITWLCNQTGGLRVAVSSDGGLIYDELNVSGAIVENDDEWQDMPWLVPDSIADRKVYIKVEEYTQPGMSEVIGPIDVKAPSVDAHYVPRNAYVYRMPAMPEAHFLPNGRIIALSAKNTSATNSSFSIIIIRQGKQHFAQLSSFSFLPARP